MIRLVLPPTIRFALVLSWAFRTVLDRFVPAAFFGFVAVGRSSLLVRRLGETPAADDAQALLVFRLDIVHQVVACIFLLLVAVLCLIRKSPRTQRAGLLPLVVALAGTFMMAYPATQPRVTEDGWVLVTASVLVIAGLVYAVYAVGSLGACFGLAAEARGLVTSGAYKHVRHPVYLGELIAALGVLLPVLTPLTAAAFVFFVALQGWRVRLEERVLGDAFEDYSEFQQRVPMLFPWPRPAK
jgi:protein-S-isoprenylcysteine O-methyltransferase Ste14